MNIAVSDSDELLESVLAELEVAAVRRDNSWIVPGPAGVELIVRLDSEGATTSAAVADLTDVNAECREAVAEFLRRAEPALSPVEANIHEHVVLLARRAGGELDVELPDALRALARACRLVVHEVRALMRPELARAYLEHSRLSHSAKRVGFASTNMGETS